MMTETTKRWLVRAAVITLAIVLGVLVCQVLRPKGLPSGFASGNGRLEAVNIDIATKIPGRVAEVLVKEGTFVTAGQVLARMDTTVLDAQRREAEAQIKRALIGVKTAQSRVAQRKAERTAAIAVMAERTAELEATQKRFARSRALAPKGVVAAQTLDDDRAAVKRATAAVASAKGQVAAAEASLGLASSEVVSAESNVEAVQAALQRIQADIDDSTLRAPRDGRIQYRVAEPGEVLPAGGTILNMVDLTDVFMTFFLPTKQAGRIALGEEARIVLDAAPQYVIPAKISFVADVAQFTPKTVETVDERQKLMFRIKAHIAPDLLRKHIRAVKTGLPGVVYVRLDPRLAWPAALQIRLPQ
jgi:HlyD family secretion protein